MQGILNGVEDDRKKMSTYFHINNDDINITMTNRIEQTAIIVDVCRDGLL